MKDSEIRGAYRTAFDDTEDDAVRYMRNFVHTLPPAQQVVLRRRRWVLPIGVAAAVAAVAVTTVAITAGGTNAVGPAGAGAVVPTASGAHPSASRTASPSPTTSARTAPTSAVSTAAATTPRSTVSSHRSSSSASNTTTTYPPIGDPGITGPLAPYATASAYTKVPAGLVVRTPADDVLTRNGVATSFSMYICAASKDPKVVDGGYLVIVTAPSVHYQSIDGQGPSSTPVGAARQLGDRSWHWNSDHTLLISTGAVAHLYIGVLATRANNEFEPTIPTGYSTADIELIAAGVRG